MSSKQEAKEGLITAVVFLFMIVGAVAYLYYK